MTSVDLGLWAQLSRKRRMGREKVLNSVLVPTAGR